MRKMSLSSLPYQGRGPRSSHAMVYDKDSMSSLRDVPYRDELCRSHQEEPKDTYCCEDEQVYSQMVQYRVGLEWFEAARVVK